MRSGALAGYPIGAGSALFSATEATFGVRVGRGFGPFGIYAKLRPGFMRFDANRYVPNLGTQHRLDFGGVLEPY